MCKLGKRNMWNKLADSSDLPVSLCGGNRRRWMQSKEAVCCAELVIRDRATVGSLSTCQELLATLPKGQMRLLLQKKHSACAALFDSSCIQQREPFSYDGGIATLQQSQSTRACNQAVFCKECSPQGPSGSTRWPTQVKQEFCCVYLHRFVERILPKSFGTLLWCVLYCRTSFKTLWTSAHGMPTDNFAMLNAPRRSVRIRASCSVATGSDAEDDDTGTSLKASVGHVTTCRPAKGKSTSKSTNKSASAAKKTAKLASKGKKSTADLAQAIGSGSAKPAAADPACPKALTASVAGNADVMLNQTNIGENNNKFYRMQLLQESNLDHWVWTRWGRWGVGDKGQTQLLGPFDAATGYKEFKKKFRCCNLNC